MKKSIMFIFVMLFMFCVGVLSVKANCQYYDENGDLMVEFDYIPVGTVLREGSSLQHYVVGALINGTNTYNLKINYVDNTYNDERYFLDIDSGINYTVTTENYCPDYILVSADSQNIGPAHDLTQYGYMVTIEPDITFDISGEWTEGFFVSLDYIQSRHIVSSAVYSLNNSTSSDHKQQKVDDVDFGDTTYRLITYSDNTYQVCVFNDYETCNILRNVNEFTFISMNGYDFTIEEGTIERLFEGENNYYFRLIGLDTLELGIYERYDPNVGEENPIYVEPVNFCENVNVLKSFRIVGYILFIAKLIIPLLLIILGSVDFAKALISSDEKAPREAAMALVRRIIIAIIIFLIPTILNFLLSLVNGVNDNTSKYTNCTSCLFDPFGDCDI